MRANSMIACGESSVSRSFSSPDCLPVSLPAALRVSAINRQNRASSARTGAGLFALRSGAWGAGWVEVATGSAPVLTSVVPETGGTGAEALTVTVTVAGREVDVPPHPATNASPTTAAAEATAEVPVKSRSVRMHLEGKTEGRRRGYENGSRAIARRNRGRRLRCSLRLVVPRPFLRLRAVRPVPATTAAVRTHALVLEQEPQREEREEERERIRRQGHERIAVRGLARRRSTARSRIG
jgi:hypothetical protein